MSRSSTWPKARRLGRLLSARRGWIWTGRTVPAFAKPVGQALLQCRVAALGRRIRFIDAPRIVWLRHGALFHADNDSDDSQDEQRISHGRLPNVGCQMLS